MISIIVPVFNNAPTLAALAERVGTALAGESWELLFVNDGSRDDSLTILRKLASTNCQIKVANLSRNFGQHPATNAGMMLARGDEIVFMDADLQDRPEDIPLLLAALRNQDQPVDIVYTIKSERHDPLVTRLTSLVFHYVHSKLTGANIPAGMGTFRAFSRKVLREMLRYQERNILYGPLMVSMGYDCLFVEVPHMERTVGKTSYSFSKRLSLAVSLIIQHTDLPYKFMLIFGGFVVSFALIYAILNIFQYLFYGRILLGGLAVIIQLLLFFSGSSFLALGIIGMYIYNIFRETLHRPRHHIMETININSKESELEAAIPFRDRLD